MLRGPLHDRGSDGNCTACGEPFPCPTGLAIYNSVVPRAEGKYRVRFVKPASSMSVEPRVVSTARVGEEWTLFWRPSQSPDGDRCYEHYEHEPIQPDDHSPRAEEVRELVRTSADANRHSGSWWTSYDIDGAAIFNDCQVEVLEGPL